MRKWETVKWEDVLTIKNGKNQKKVNNPNGKYPIYGSGGIMGRADDFLCEEGTTIIGRKGSINNPIYVLEKFWNVDTAFGLSPKKGLDKKFFYYFCTTYNFLKHNKATTLPSLTKADLLKIEIPLPPLPQQQKIAAILDAADALRQNDKALVAKYDELTHALFLDMFGDALTNPFNFRRSEIGNVINIIGGSQPAKKFFKSEPEEGYVRLVQIRDYKSDRFLTFIPTLSTKKFCTASDIMIGRYGPPVFQILRGIDGAYNVALMKALPKKALKSEYIFHLLSCNYIQDIIIANSQRTAGQTGVNLKLLNSIEINVPPLELQNQFAERVTLIQEQKIIAQKGLERSEELFNSLLQKAFKGELI